ncbi:hypothetical protein FRB93_012984 [Tulasnella sp. JGI-2019a]|nr:hypothetical protein FRB93_012984 [Tulasnella sp. JGI-2019a]
MRNYSRIALLQKKRLQAHIRKLQKTSISYSSSTTVTTESHPEMSGPEGNPTSDMPTTTTSTSSSLPISSEPPNRTQSLANILAGDVGNATPDEGNEAGSDAMDEEPETVAKEGYCIECEDQPADVLCEACHDNFCQVCFQAQHRKGKRKAHTTKPLGSPPSPEVKNAQPPQSPTTVNGRRFTADTIIDETASHDIDIDEAAETSAPATPPVLPIPSGYQPAIGSSVGDWFLQRARYIPLRLTPEERKYLRLLEGALTVSEYTNKIDIYSFSTSKPKRVVQQIRELCAIIAGLLLAADYNLGQQLFTERNFEANADFYQRIFEIGRRHKIQNPDRMRDNYGKLIYILMDAQTPEVTDLLGFSLVDPEQQTVNTVYQALEEAGCLDVLSDDLIGVATMEIVAEGKDRRVVQREIKAKEKAVETLAAKYSGVKTGRNERSSKPEIIRQCLYSIGDNHAFLRVNRDPCDKMISYLKQYFDPTKPEPSLTIRSGRAGARLSHSHEKQYAYVLQSLTLWREILHDMFKLWGLAEQDLLSSTTTYRLRDTGQGLQRVQACPRTSRIMHSILNKAQQNIGSWVGSSVVHLGDTAVPNALMFIDKYSQIYRILLPITNVLSQIPVLSGKPAIKSYIDNEFGGTENLIVEILTDVFRHAFDGSGADNFYDAGSCIDGRLTSAWNWCSLLEKKRFFPVFLLTGFVGFDGQWA